MTLNCFIPAPPLKLIDLPGIDQRAVDDSVVSVFNYFFSTKILGS
jgi:hypothetical protein